MKNGLEFAILPAGFFEIAGFGCFGHRNPAILLSGFLEGRSMSPCPDRRDDATEEAQSDGIG